MKLSGVILLCCALLVKGEFCVFIHMLLIIQKQKTLETVNMHGRGIVSSVNLRAIIYKLYIIVNLICSKTLE